MDIFVKSEIKPVHSFDVWGPILDNHRAGPMILEMYAELAKKQNIPYDISKQNIDNFQILLDGGLKEAGLDKKTVVSAIRVPVDATGLPKDYSNSFNDDGLYAIRQILEAGEDVIIFGSEKDKDLMAQLPKDIGERVTDHEGNKVADPEAFIKVYEAEKAIGRTIVSHTEDDINALKMALKTPHFSKHYNKTNPTFLGEGTAVPIYIDRNGKIKEKEALDLGIVFATDLETIKYNQVVPK